MASGTSCSTGSPFINAAAEYPDLASPVGLRATKHRTWFREAVADLLRANGRPTPVPAAASLLLLDLMLRSADALLNDDGI